MTPPDIFLFQRAAAAYVLRCSRTSVWLGCPDDSVRFKQSVETNFKSNTLLQLTINFIHNKVYFFFVTE
jgi:hypothetical protein